MSDSFYNWKTEKSPIVLRMYGKYVTVELPQGPREGETMTRWIRQEELLADRKMLPEESAPVMVLENGMLVIYSFSEGNRSTVNVQVFAQGAWRNVSVSEKI